MYNLEKRAYFTNLGELRMLLANMPDDTEVCTIGVLGSYLHFSKENNLVSFDDEDLGDRPDCYVELENDDIGELYEKKQAEENLESCSRIDWINTGRQYFFVGDKLMRTYLTDDGSWDYELYDLSLSVVDSGQLGENRNMTRDEAIDIVLSWNKLDEKPRHYTTFSNDLREHFEDQGFYF